MAIYQPIPFGTPPFVPVPYSGGYLPPFGGIDYSGGVTRVPAPQGGPAQTMSEVSGPYTPGPFCFGLDKLICANLPENIKLRFGVQIPAQEICKAIANLLCVVLVVAVLAGIVYLGVYGLVLGEERSALGG